MEMFKQKLRQLVAQDMESLVTVFLGSLLGTLVTAMFLMASTASMDQLDWFGRLLLSVSAALIYGCTVGGTYYVLLPRRRR